MTDPPKRNPIIDRVLRRNPQDPSSGGSSGSGGSGGGRSDPTGGTVIVFDPINQKSAVVQATPENLRIIERGRQLTVSNRSAAITREKVVSNLNKVGIKSTVTKKGDVLFIDKKGTRQKVVIGRKGIVNELAVKSSSRLKLTPTKKKLVRQQSRNLFRGVSLKQIQPLSKLRVKQPKVKLKTKVIKSLSKDRAIFESTIIRRQNEAASISRQLDRKVKSGKKLTTNEKRAKTAAGLQNVGIEVIAGLAAIPLALSRPKETGKALLFALANPDKVILQMIKDVRRNPSGFIASVIGVQGFFGATGKITKVTVKAAGSSLKYTGKLGTRTVRGTIKVTGKGARSSVKIVSRSGKKIFTKVKNVRFKGKRVFKARKIKKPRQKPIHVLNKLEIQINAIRRSRKSLQRLIFKPGKHGSLILKKNIPKGLREGIRKMVQKENKLLKKVKGQTKAPTQEFIKQAQKEALRLKQAVDKASRRIAKTKKEIAVSKSSLLKRSKARTRRGKVIARRTAKKAKGKKGRKESRKSFRRSAIRKELINIRDQSEKLAKVRGQLNFNTVNKKINIDNKILKIKLSALAVDKKISKSIVDFFSATDKAVVKSVKGPLKGKGVITKSIRKKSKFNIGDIPKIFPSGKPISATMRIRLLKEARKVESGRAAFRIGKKAQSRLVNPEIVIKRLDTISRRIKSTGSKFVKKVKSKAAKRLVANQARSRLKKITKIKTAIRKGLVSVAVIAVRNISTTGTKSGQRITSTPKKPIRVITTTKDKKPIVIQDEKQIPIVVPSVPLDRLSKTQQAQLVTKILLQVLGTAAIIRASGRRIATPQTKQRGGIARLRKFIFRKLKAKSFRFTPDIYSVIFGIRAKPNERIKLLKPGRFFTGLERRKLV